MKDNDIQLRGHCPMCGRQQAVRNGFMSKHGYRVDHGWFEGVCPGQNFQPLEANRTGADKAYAQIEDDCDGMNNKAVELRTGRAHPQTGKGGPRMKLVSNDGRNRQYWDRETMPWDQLSDSEKRQTVDIAAHSLEQRATTGLRFVFDMRVLADAVHGRPLDEVKRDRSGPLLHAHDPDPKFSAKYAACGKSIRYGHGTRWLNMASSFSNVSCPACLEAAAKCVIDVDS